MIILNVTLLHCFNKSTAIRSRESVGNSI